MNYKKLRALYEGSPGAVKAVVGLVPFGVVAGRGYREAFRRGRSIDRARREELLAYQRQALGRMLAFACDQVPAYAPFRSVVERLSPTEALKAFPLLDKETLQRDLPRYLPRDFERIPHYECSTGGTTGNQLKFFVDDNSQSVEMGFMHRQWARVGYTPRHRKATFRGVEFPHLRDGVYWQLNPIYNEMQFSPFHMNDQTLGKYLDCMFAYRPHYLHGYPSAITILAEYVRRTGVSLRGLPLRAALLGSEATYPDQRAMIEETFAVRAYSWYGHSERVILAGECERGGAYHHFPDYGVLEIVDDRGEVVDRDGESGELIGTGLLNRSMPLVRYRTGDRARKLPYRCECGREFDRFDQVEGRWKQEFLIGRNGSRISTAALNMHGPLFERVVRYQYFQDTPGRMELRIMVSGDFAPDEEVPVLERAFARKSGDELAVTVRVVDDIPLTGRGKYRRLVQAIPDADLSVSPR